MEPIKVIHDSFWNKHDSFQNEAEMFRNIVCTSISRNTTASDDQAVHAAIKDIVDSIKNEAEAAGKHVPYIFMNDASYDQDVIAGYGKENVAKLRAISAQYDPHQVFQKLVPGGFKLPKS